MDNWLLCDYGMSKSRFEIQRNTHSGLLFLLTVNVILSYCHWGLTQGTGNERLPTNNKRHIPSGRYCARVNNMTTAYGRQSTVIVDHRRDQSLFRKHLSFFPDNNSQKNWGRKVLLRPLRLTRILPVFCMCGTSRTSICMVTFFASLHAATYHQWLQNYCSMTSSWPALIKLPMNFVDDSL